MTSEVIYYKMKICVFIIFEILSICYQYRFINKCARKTSPLKSYTDPIYISKLPAAHSICKLHIYSTKVVLIKKVRPDSKSRLLLFILLFFFPLFLRGKRKGEKNNQSRDFKSYLSARS